MKRFFCTVCKKMKRVRKYPAKSKHQRQRIHTSVLDSVSITSVSKEIIIMITTNRPVTKLGECDICGQFDCKVWQTPGNIWMCEPCKAKEDKLQAENSAETELRLQQESLRGLTELSRQTDQNVQLKTDIFLADTVAAVELKAAIQADDTVAEADKQFALANECQTRYMHYKEVVFAAREALAEAENKMRMWQTKVRK